MKARLLILLSLAILVTVSAAAGATMLRTGSHTGGDDRSGIVTVDVASLHVGGVAAKTIPVVALHGVRLPIYVVREAPKRVVAFLGRSPRLGCRLGWVGDPNYQRFTTVSSVAFEDPCGGSLFSITGACLGGPCVRGMDRFAVTVTDGAAHVDVSALIAGRPRLGHLRALPTRLAFSDGNSP